MRHSKQFREAGPVSSRGSGNAGRSGFLPRKEKRNDTGKDDTGRERNGIGVVLELWNNHYNYKRSIPLWLAGRRDGRWYMYIDSVPRACYLLGIKEMSIYVPSSGPSNARVVAVGEGPGAVEERELAPFVGPSGDLLRRLLRKAGINSDEVLFTNVSRFRPPNNDMAQFIRPLPKKLPRGWETNGFRDSDLSGPYEIYNAKIVLPFIPRHIETLFREIEEAKPKVVLALGRTALWALTGKDLSIDKWKGSVMPVTINGHDTLIIPVQHPAYILRIFKARFHTEQYLRKAAYYLSNPYEEQKENFITRPSFEEVVSHLWVIGRTHHGRLFCDIETIHRTHIECIGICDEHEEVICIPFIEDGKNYWEKYEEVEIIKGLKYALTNNPIIGHNFFYDAQYVFNEWLCTPNLVWDTMLTHHTMFPSTEKALDYVSSIYLDNHIYWKGTAQGDRWIYNCRDCLTTKRVYEVQKTLAVRSRQEDQIAEQNALYRPVLRMMLRGVKRDMDETARMVLKAQGVIDEIDNDVSNICGYPLNIQSHDQVKDLFYDQLLQQPVISRKTHSESVDDSALGTISNREPALKPLTDKISLRRSFNTIRSTFLEARSDVDGRLRYSLNIAGTVTFRFASSKAVNDYGLNVQNIKRMEDEDEQRLEKYPRPQVRKMFIPDPGFTLVNSDLKSAEFYVVVWEAGDALFKQMLREGVSVHKENAKLLEISRDKAKGFIYATNYLATPRTCAAQFGMTVHEAERYQDRYFSEHPSIKAWHRRVIRKLSETATVENIFNYRITYYDRLEGLYAEAIDWVPQSTIAIIIDKAILNIEKNLPSVQMLFQNHDSIVAQIPTERKDELIPLIEQNMLIPVPYNDPLVIPVEIKTSEKSWGEVR